MAKLNRAIQILETSTISPNPNQPRKFFDEDAIDELAESIKTCGIIQPLTVRQVGLNAYEVISGERRLRAAKKVKLAKIPCIIVKSEDETYDLISLIENIQREDLNYFEEAKAYSYMIENYNFTQQELALKIGKKQSTISNKIRLLKLPKEVIDVIMENNLTERHARALLNLPDNEMRLKAVKEIAKRDLNVKATEDLIERLKSEILLNSKKRNIKNIFNYKIYTNTIKKAYQSIVLTGLDANYTENEYDDRIEVVITIPRENK